MTKKVITFWRKNKVTALVTAAGDNNLSDATADRILCENWENCVNWWGTLVIRLESLYLVLSP